MGSNPTSAELWDGRLVAIPEDCKNNYREVRKMFCETCGKEFFNDWRNPKTENRTGMIQNYLLFRVILIIKLLLYSFDKNK